MTKTILIACLLFAALADRAFAAQEPAAGAMKTLAVGKVKANQSVVAAAAAKKESLDRMLESLDGQIVSAIQQTRKFTLLARSDAGSLVEEAAATGKPFSFGAADYLLILTIDDFQDLVETAKFASLGKEMRKRQIRFSAVGKIYDVKTNKIIETANFQEQLSDIGQGGSNIKGDGDSSDSLLVGLTRIISEKIAQRVVDVVYPARIVGKTGKVITINRGDGTGIAKDQTWEAFALGDELKDPDTGASLGREEISVGKVRVTRVNPTLSQAAIVGEDLGVDRGAILRRVDEAPAPEKP
jgi:curli biogenesis system outer membrane secretion channel CsgG